MNHLRMLLLTLLGSGCFYLVSFVWAQEKKLFNPYAHGKPYEAEAYVPPPSPKSHLNPLDNGDESL